MKKHLTILSIALLSILGVKAQQNTYSMVITMNNGSTISIGPNEIKNISFNDGQITISGTSIETLLKGYSDSNQKMDDLWADLSGRAKSLQEQIDALKAMSATFTQCQCDLSNFYTMEAVNELLSNYATREDVVNVKKNADEAMAIAQIAYEAAQNTQGGGSSPVWTIGSDGYWYRDGVKTEYRAVGMDGRDGIDGMDAMALNITLKKDPTDGNYYWVIDGQWVLDVNGQRVQANGKDGVDGADGMDADVWTIGPDGYWYKNGVKTDYRAIGYDGKDGKDGEKGVQGVQGEKGDKGDPGEKGEKGDPGDELITSVTIQLDGAGNRYARFTLYDGSQFRVLLAE